MIISEIGEVLWKLSLGESFWQYFCKIFPSKDNQVYSILLIIIDDVVFV